MNITEKPNQPKAKEVQSFYYVTARKGGRPRACIRTYCLKCGKLHYVDHDGLYSAKRKGEAINCTCGNKIFNKEQVKAGENVLERISEGKSIDLYIPWKRAMMVNKEQQNPRAKYQ